MNAVSRVPRPLIHLFLATAESYILVTFYPQYAGDYSMRGLLWRLFLIHILLQIFWDIAIYPEFLSPLRHLPRPNGWFTGDVILFESPRGASCLRWMNTIPNEGLIRLKAYDGGEFPLITSPEIYAEVLVHSAYDYEKPYLVRKFLSRILGWGLIAAEGDMHRAQRRALLPAFQLKNIKDLAPLMWDKSMLLTEMLARELELAKSKSKSKSKFSGEAPDHSLEIGKWASRLTLDIIGPAAMGRDFQSLQDSSNLVASNYLELLQPNIRRLMFFALALIVPPWVSENWPSRVNTSIKRTIREVRDVCLDIIREKKRGLAAETEESRQKDVLSTMLRAGDLDDQVCVDQMLTFLAAGHETTANALVWTCHLLGLHPHYQTLLRDELRTAIPDPSDPYTAASNLDTLPLLNGICNEVLRLHPTVPITVRAPTRDVVLAGTRVPRGVWLVLCPYATNRDPRLWGDDAGDFRPERWIDEVEADGDVELDGADRDDRVDGADRDDRVDGADRDDGASGTQGGKKGVPGKRRLNAHGGSSTNYALMTFLHGPRACIGQGFARAELRAAVAALFGRFELELRDPDAEVVSVGAVTTKPRDGMWVTLRGLEGWCGR